MYLSIYLSIHLSIYQRIPAGHVTSYRQRSANGFSGCRILGLQKIRAKRNLRLKDFGVKAS